MTGGLIGISSQGEPLTVGKDILSCQHNGTQIETPKSTLMNDILIFDSAQMKRYNIIFILFQPPRNMG
jgi:hypothetical protein